MRLWAPALAGMSALMFSPLNAAEPVYLDELTAMSVGSFSTIAQAREDSRYGVAEAEIVRIWPDRTDGVWLYQEQALIGESAAAVDRAMKAKPYFQRVIHSVETAPGTVSRSVHRLKEPKEALGAWKSNKPLSGLSPEDLI